MNSENKSFDLTFVATAQAEKEMDEILQSAFKSSSATKKKGMSSSQNIRTQSQFVATPEAEKEMDDFLQTVFRHSSPPIALAESEVDGEIPPLVDGVDSDDDDVESQPDPET